MTEKEAKKRKVSFVAGDEKGTNPGNSSDLTAEMRQMLAVQKQHKDLLEKSVKPVTIDHEVKGKYSKNKIVFSAKSFDQGYEGVENKGYKRLTDQELRETSNVDPYISAIISTRCSQAAVIARESDSKFDKGTRVIDLNPASLEDFDGNDDDFQRHQEMKEKQSKVILDWIWNCGTKDENILNEVFHDPRSDQLFKHCTLADYLSAQIRNIMTFGRCATQIFRNEEGLPILFRPVPVETIYNIKDKDDSYIGESEETFEQSVKDMDAYNNLPEEFRPYAYVQKVDGRNVNFFTEDDLKIDYFQKQALFDLRGYPLAPIEMAIYMVFVHQNTLSYLRNQFVKGLGTKGVLTIESTDPAGDLSGEDMEDLRRQFHNFLNRTDNSATTPVIAGPAKVNWIPLSSNPRDMEFLEVEEHVIRALCSAFQTSPQEMGYGHLSRNQGGLTSANKQEEIVRGEERGLRMLLDIMYDRINDILYENFDDARDRYRVTYTGVGEDTRDAVVQRHQQELQTTATLASLYSDSEKNEPIPMGGNVPLSSLFHQNVVRYMKYGEFMEKYMGMEGWSEKEEYDFIIDAQLNQAYQTKLGMSNEMLQAQGEIQLETQAKQLEQMEAQTEQVEMEVQAMEAQMGQPGMGMPMGGMPGEQPAEDPQGQPVADEEMPKSQSLREVYASKLAKSMGHYFSEWTKAHYYDDEEPENDTDSKAT